MILRPEYASLAHKCIEKYPELKSLREHPCSIAYLGSNKQKSSHGRVTYADCTKIPSKYKWMAEDAYDFMITVYEKSCMHLTDEQMEILMLHELMHIEVTEIGDGTATYSIRDHDVQDFRAIIEAYGIDWALPANAKNKAAEEDSLPGQISFTSAAYGVTGGSDGN